MDEIAPLAELSRPPGMPSSVLGFLNLGGEAIVVMDAAQVFGTVPDGDIDPIYRHILIIRDGEDKLGLLVDRVEDVCTIGREGITAVAQDHSLNGCVTGTAECDGEDVHLLASDRILLQAEKVRMSDLRQAEQARLEAMSS